MGHSAGKEVYRRLGRKIDNLPMRAPWNEAFYNVLREIYSEDEADVVVKMPHGSSELDQIAHVTKRDSSELLKILERLCSKGLVMDMCINDTYITICLRRL